MAEDKSSTKEKTKTDKEVKPDKPTSDKKGLIWGIIGGVLFVVVLVACFLFLKPKTVADDPKNSPSYSPSFFIYANGGYSLWNKDGVRLTQDVYDDKSNFIGGYAYVKKGNEYAILSETGVMTMDFGKISRVISSYAGLFLVEDNSGARMLIKGKGDVLLAGEDLSIDSASGSAAFLVAESGNNYYVYNYAGKLVMQFAKVDSSDEEVRMSANTDFALVYYNGSNLVFDARTGQQLALFEAERYSIEDVSEDRSMVILNKYDDDDGGDYKLIANGKLYDLTEKMFYGLVRDTNMLVGYDDSYDTVALLNGEFKVEKEVASDVAIKDNKNYATLSEEGKVQIYQNGNMVKEFGEDSELDSGVLVGADLYAIKDGEKYAYYHLDGSLAFGEYEDVYGLFNKFHHSAVAEDEDTYYMIDANGKRVNDLTFRRMYAYDHSYLLTNADGKRAILDEAGVPVTGFDYVEAYNRSSAVDHEIWSLKKEANKYDVIDVTAQNKFLLTDVNTYDFYANYFVTKNSDGKKEFYTYTGVKFYTEE